MKYALISVAFLLYLTTPVYAQNIPPDAPTITHATSYSKEWILGRIDYYADQYNVSPETMRSIVSCESNFNFNAKHISSKEYSVGLVQINLKAHQIDEYDAKAPNFALDFLARNLSEGRGSMWVCFQQLGTS